ncbi:MAG TPA: protease inhibitor I42 family protein [Candidatus Eisenbacteria bacterium]|nr:protease inhibitor I42 family protein [Candidatus Eisenbacteria bacterium]
MKWTSRILILAILFAAMFGCQKGQKAAASKEGRSSTSAKVKNASAKPAGKTATSKSESSKSGSSKTSTANASASHQKSSTLHFTHPGVLTMADNARTFDVRQGEVITVKLDSNHSSGFSWALAEDIGAVVKQDGKAVYARNTSKTGKILSGGNETWRFRAVGAGRETVKLEYRRSWERNFPDRTFRFSLNVQ